MEPSTGSQPIGSCATLCSNLGAFERAIDPDTTDCFDYIATESSSAIVPDLLFQYTSSSAKDSQGNDFSDTINWNENAAAQSMDCVADNGSVIYDASVVGRVSGLAASLGKLCASVPRHMVHRDVVCRK